VFFTEFAFASEGAEAAVEGGGLATTLGSVYPNPANIWPTWLAFGILFFLLYKFAMPAVLGMVDARAARIRESLEKAEETKVEAERLMGAMEAEKKAAIADLQAQVAELSVAVAGKIIGEKLSADEHARLIEQYMSEVGGLNDN